MFLLSHRLEDCTLLYPNLPDLDKDSGNFPDTHKKLGSRLALGLKMRQLFFSCLYYTLFLVFS